MTGSVQRRDLLARLFLLVGFLTGGCAPRKEAAMSQQQQQQLERTRAVLARHRERLVEEHGATGSGIGRDGDRYVIVLYVESPRGEAEPLPEIEGVPVQFRVTGRFRRLGDEPNDPPP